MRFVTWNCCRGDPAAKLGALAGLSADVACVQECGRSEPLGARHAWFGANPKQGVAVVTANTFEVEAVATASTGSAYAARISGPTSFNLLVVWAQRSPTYARAVLDALAEHRELLLTGPAVVAGDFNTCGAITKEARGGRPRRYRPRARGARPRERLPPLLRR